MNQDIFAQARVAHAELCDIYDEAFGYPAYHAPNAADRAAIAAAARRLDEANAVLLAAYIEKYPVLRLPK